MAKPQVSAEQKAMALRMAETCLLSDDKVEVLLAKALLAAQAKLEEAEAALAVEKWELGYCKATLDRTTVELAAAEAKLGELHTTRALTLMLASQIGQAMVATAARNITAGANVIEAYLLQKGFTIAGGAEDLTPEEEAEMIKLIKQLRAMKGSKA